MSQHAQKQNGGVLLGVLVTLLVFFGVLAGMQTLIVVQADLCTRALALEHQDAVLRQRARLVLQEGFQSSLDARDPAHFPERVGRVMEALGHDGGILEIEGLEAGISSVNWLPMLDPTPAPLEEVPRHVTLVHPGLGLWVGMPASLGPERTLRVVLHAPGGAPVPGVWTLQVRSVGVPLCANRICHYELPSELGSQRPGGGELGLGLATHGGDAAGQQLLAPGSRPYHFRGKASLAHAYASLFSSQGMGPLRAAAGTEGFALLERGAVRLSGLGEALGTAGAAATLDLSGASLPRVMLVSALDDSLGLRLVEAVPGAQTSPLVLVVLGARTAPLRLVLGNCHRPVLLLAASVRVEAAPGTRWSGGLILDPASRLDESTTEVHLSHFSGHATQAPRAGAVRVDQPQPAALGVLYPRVHYAMVEGGP